MHHVILENAPLHSDFSLALPDQLSRLGILSLHLPQLEILLLISQLQLVLPLLVSFVGGRLFLLQLPQKLVRFLGRRLELFELAILLGLHRFDGLPQLADALVDLILVLSGLGDELHCLL